MDPLIHQRTRLRIMTVLYRNRQVPFTDLRDELELTDGNLKSHADKLEDAGYLAARRVLTGTRFEVRYVLTADGAEAFRDYLAELQSLLDGVRDSPADVDADAPGDEDAAGAGTQSVT